MQWDPTTPAILLVAVLGSLTQSTFGFGNALVMMPLLAMFVDVQTATPLVALVALTTHSTALSQRWQHVQVKPTWRLVVGSLAGIPLGLWVLRGAYDRPMKLCLGLLVLLFSLNALFGKRTGRLKTDRSAYVFGFVAGVLAGAFNTNGPPVVMFGSLRRWPREQFRATLQGYFLPCGILVIAGHACAGLWTPHVLRLFALSIPFAILSVFVGLRIGSRLPTGKFDRAIHIILAITGGLLLVKTLAGA